MSVKRIFVAGHNGMVGSSIVRQLKLRSNVVIITRTRSELNLLSQADVQAFFNEQIIDEVYLAAAKVGGIVANNTYPAEFIYENLMIQSNVIHSAYQAGVKKLLFLGSSCIYPKFAKQPMTEEELLGGKLEPTNEPYAIAKIAGIKMCESYNRQYETDYRSVMPTNLYGPGDNYHSQNSHVIPGLIRRFHEAKISGDPVVFAWGTGKVFREFLFVEDMAEAAILVMNFEKCKFGSLSRHFDTHINVGSGEEITIRKLTELIADVIGYIGEIKWDTDKPDGTPRKIMDNSKMLELGWRPSTDLKTGLSRAYQEFLNNCK